MKPNGYASGAVEGNSASTRIARVPSAPTTRYLSLQVRMLPILFFIAYLSFTVYVFAFGPWPWPVANAGKLYCFLALAHTALLLGFVSGAAGRPAGYLGHLKPEQLVAASLIANVAVLGPTSAFRSGSLIPDIARGLAEPGAVYYASRTAWTQGALVEYVRIMLGPLLALLLPLTIYYWHRLKPIVRTLAVLSHAAFLAIYIAIGTNKAIADSVLLVPCLLIAGICAGSIRFDRRRLLPIAVATAIPLSLFLLFFTRGQISRLGSQQRLEYFSYLDIHADPNNPLLRWLPRSFRAGAIALASYTTQGYYGLSLALEEPFVPMFGFGNSRFLYTNAAEITGCDAILQAPYPARLQAEGKWDAYGHWSTIYPWIASDVSFVGTILVVFLIGRLFSLSWLDTLRGANPYAVAAFAQFAIMIFYFPANNQYMQSGESFSAFWGILLLWLLTRRRYVWRPRYGRMPQKPQAAMHH